MNIKSAAIAAALVILLPGSSAFAAEPVMIEEPSAYTGEVTFDGDLGILPLDKAQMHPIAVGSLGDAAPLSLIIDTGAGVNVIDESIAEEHGFEVIGQTEIGAPGGPQIVGNVVRVPLLEIGAVRITNAEFVTMDIIGFSRGTMHGVIGTTLFTDYLVTFDREASQVELVRGVLSETDDDVIAYDPEGAQVNIDIDVAGQAMTGHVDTGSMGSFMLPGETMSSFTIVEDVRQGKARVVGGPRDIKIAELQGIISFAGFEFENPKVAFMTPSTGKANIGSRVLSKYRMTLDHKNHLIRFADL